MLDELHVADVGVIEDLTISLDQGMTVLSGETGAGKTLIIGALSLLAGQRADAGLIRSGSKSARAEARFTEGAEEIVIAREIWQGGPSKSYINGSLARVSDIAELTLRLFHIYGQHEAQLLFSPVAQAEILDRFSRVDYSKLDGLRAQLKSAQDRLSELGGDERARSRELAMSQYEYDEISAAEISSPFEEDEINEELKLLSNVLEFRTALNGVHEILIDGTELASAMDQLGRARRILEQTGDYSTFIDGLSRQIEELREIGRGVSAELDRLESDPDRFEHLQERLLQLSKLKRKYGDTLGDVIDYREKLSSKINDLTSVELVAERLEKEMEGYRVEIAGLEKEVFEKRAEGAGRLSKAIEDHLSALAMPNGRFEVELAASRTGDPVTFMFSSSAGEKLGAVAKIASGGELSRLMLAIRLVADSDVQTMVFDEVDAGVGGTAGVKIGQALARLSEKKQVVVVTHLPQVASFAHQHIAISKVTRKGRSVTVAKAVEGEERVSELARMLSGHDHSEKAREHARELLARAANRYVEPS